MKASVYCSQRLPRPVHNGDVKELAAESDSALAACRRFIEGLHHSPAIINLVSGRRKRGDVRAGDGPRPPPDDRARPDRVRHPVYGVRCFRYRQKSATWDEPIHHAADTSEIDRTRVTAWFNRGYDFARRFLYVQNDADHLLYRARFMVVLWGHVQEPVTFISISPSTAG